MREDWSRGDRRCRLRLTVFRSESRFRVAPRFVRRAFGDELVLKLRNKTLYRPGTGLAKSANRAAARNVVRYAQQVVRVAGTTLAVSHSVQCFGHPQRAFPARGALPAALVRVEFA